MESRFTTIYDYNSAKMYSIINGDHCTVTDITGQTRYTQRSGTDLNGTDFHLKHTRDLFSATTYFGHSLNYTVQQPTTVRGMPAENWLSSSSDGSVSYYFSDSAAPANWKLHGTNGTQVPLRVVLQGGPEHVHHVTDIVGFNVGRPALSMFRVPAGNSAPCNPNSAPIQHQFSTV